MKRAIYLILIIFILLVGNIITYTAANCGGVLDNGVGSWTVGSSCTVSNGLYSAWGNTIVGGNTITIASDAALITNLVSNNMTFTSGRINMSGGATIYGNSSEFTWYNPDTPTGVAVTGGGYTQCPSGTNVWNPITNSIASSVVNASRRGWIVCK